MAEILPIGVKLYPINQSINQYLICLATASLDLEPDLISMHTKYTRASCVKKLLLAGNITTYGSIKLEGN